VRCTSCHHENREGARFCADCGEVLSEERACARCGARSPAGTRFCDRCGNPLGASSEPGAEPAERAPRDYTPKQPKTGIG
jgi:predicted amidophosphoribosyltransferase